MSGHRSIPYASIAAAIIVALALLPPVATAQDPVRPEDELTEDVEVRLQTARLRIEPRSHAEPGECLELDVSDLKVYLRGKRVTNPEDIRLERERRPTVHALLIDTSGSMRGKLHHVRRAASEYIRGLDPEFDRGLIASFDESLLLMTGATSDKEALVRGIESMRMSASTTLNDGLYYIIRELDGHYERPVILVLSDGMDTSSLYDRWDVMELIESREDLSVFVIGLDMPWVRGVTGTPKKFLSRLANRTNGKMFDIPTGSRLDKIYLRIREMLQNEAVLTVADPDPDAGPAKIKVSSLRPDCKIRVFRTADEPVEDPARKPIRGTPPPLPVRYSMPPSGLYAKPQIKSAPAVMDPECRPRHIPPYANEEDILDAAWYVEAERGMIRGCGLDVTMEYGLLYQPLGPDLSAQVTQNKWLGLKTRPFEIEVPPLRSLPTDPVVAMDTLAERAVARAGQPVEIYELHVPPEMHARPYHDYPELAHGSHFLEMRPRIARALYAHDEYREWVLERLRVEAGAAMEALERRYHRQFPEVPESAIREAARLSAEGQEIQLRASAPTEVDLQRHFTAWLGDIPAHTLFVRWEVEQINAFLRNFDRDFGEPRLEQAVERWQELRQLFFVPSYARVMTLLTLTHDPSTDRIGFWRVLLPRPGWLEARIKGDRNREEYTDFPLDLVPDQPFGLWIVANIGEHRPDLADRIRRSRLDSIVYQITADPRHHNPQSAFRETRVRLLFEPDDAPGHEAKFAIVADVSLDVETPILLSVVSQECGPFGDCLATVCGPFEECDVYGTLEAYPEELVDDLSRLDTPFYGTAADSLPALPGLDFGFTVPSRPGPRRPGVTVGGL